MIDPSVVTANLAGLHERIASCGRDPEDITIVAVTKGFGVDAVEAAVAAGLTDIGENYAQEILTKHAAAPEARWHFIGRLQSNKVAQLAGSIDEWQSLDRPKLISRVAQHSPGARVHIQVNISDEPNKGGCTPIAAVNLIAQARNAGLEVVALMGVASIEGDVGSQFRLLRTLADEAGVAGCSMGMSADLELAVREGSTMVRVGTGLFGPRPERERGT